MLHNIHIGREDMIIYLHPHVKNEPLTDMAAHRIEPIALNRVIGLPLLVMKYYDYKILAPCYGIILVDGGKFYRIPLLQNAEFIEMLNLDGWLEPIDIGILPSTIWTKKAARDWPELIASLGDAAFQSTASTPRVRNSSKAQSEKEKPKKRHRAIITLYAISETAIYQSNSAGNNTFQTITYDSLHRLLENYDIIWRRVDQSLAKESEFNSVLKACEHYLSANNATYWIYETCQNHNATDQATDDQGELLPLFYGNHIHRYKVDIRGK